MYFRVREIERTHRVKRIRDRLVDYEEFDQLHIAYAEILLKQLIEMNGNFTLYFSRIGYMSLEFPLDSENKITVSLFSFWNPIAINSVT